ncbi:hypothetical protein [Peribacillus loiseleuriae]|uniref:Histidine kinase n=1 Tax=Peribacillus loiseleuriae TaxID=1679170 RepID=A0A0K9GY12_9BACI|nr:hypothetical protein [Peribacillus loiseleuriae]KMY51543.1 hypothetical protein AC625_19985 [Peribacillus loiseleuriae]
MKRFNIVILVMIGVTILATWKLGKDYSAIQLQTRILIIAGGAILSGVLTYFLSKRDVDRVDPKPDK